MPFPTSFSLHIPYAATSLTPALIQPSSLSLPRCCRPTDHAEPHLRALHRGCRCPHIRTPRWGNPRSPAGSGALRVRKRCVKIAASPARKQPRARFSPWLAPCQQPHTCAPFLPGLKPPPVGTHGFHPADSPQTCTQPGSSRRKPAAFTLQTAPCADRSSSRLKSMASIQHAAPTHASTPTHSPACASGKTPSRRTAAGFDTLGDGEPLAASALGCGHGSPAAAPWRGSLLLLSWV